MHLPGGEGGGGVNILEDARYIGLASYSIISLRLRSIELTKGEGTFCFLQQMCTIFSFSAGKGKRNSSEETDEE
jgi:hypothetical protein